MGWTRTYGVGQVVVGEAHDIILPRKWKGDGTVRGVIFCHGHDGDALTPQTNQPEVRQLAARGLPVYATDLGGLRTWGNDTFQTRVGQAWADMKTRYGVKTDKMLLYGGSMGGGAALTYAATNPSTVAAVGAMKPAVDFDDIHDNDRLSLATSVETAYGGLAAWDAAKPTHNPMDVAGSLQPPSMLWASTDDPVCLYSRAQAFSAASGSLLVSVGANLHTFPVPGITGNEVADFLLAYSR